MTKKRIKSQDENITTEDLGNGYTRVRVEGPNSVQRARDFIDTNFDNPAYYQGNLKDLEVVAYDPKSLASKEADRFSRMVGFPTASEMGTTYKYVEPSKPKVDDGFTDAERERYLHNLEKSGFDFDYANKVLKADRHASQYNPENFLKATGINALDPTQWVGAFSDKLTGKADENGNPIGFWQSLGYGNSGFVTDKFMKEHPIWGTATKMIGGGATIGLGNKALNLTRPLVQNAARQGAQLAKRIYDNGTLWDKYTTLGGRFGYYGKTPMSRFVGTVQRRFNFGSPAPRMPELIRAEKHGINFHPEEGIKERFPWINTTTTQPVISHPQGNWNGSDVIIYDPNMIEDPRRYLSIDPMDTFITGKLIPNKGQATVVSGNPNVLRQAKAVGYETVSSPRLRKLYPILQDKNANRPGIPLKLKIKMQPVERTQEALDYMNEIQRLISRRGLPTLRDYQYQSLQTGLPLPNFNPNLSQINLRGRSFASPLRFDTSPSTESNFKIRIGMNRNGTWPDHSPNILDDKGLQEAARNPNYDVNSFQNNPFEGFFNSENMFSK